MTVQTPKVALSDGFLGAFARIPKAQQKKVQEFISKFRQDPTSNGLNYEKIHDARSKNVHSVRIDQTYRGIVLKPEQGALYMLMWVDKHDEAYDWRGGMIVRFTRLPARFRSLILAISNRHRKRWLINRNSSRLTARNRFWPWACRLSLLIR